MLQRAHIQLYRGPSVADFLASRSADLVIDVGANIGQYASGLRLTGYEGAIHSFEPIDAVHAQLAAAAAGDPHWQVTRSAVGAQAGEVVIGVSHNTVFSSIKKTTERAARFDAASAAVRAETVPITTLDLAMRDVPGTRVFLKIDTQGFEQEVLAGAAETLARCVGLQLELPIEHFYEDVWSFEEALAFARGYGFVPAQIRPVNFSTIDSAVAVEFDCVFRRESASR